MVTFHDFGKRTATCFGKGFDGEVVIGAHVQSTHVISSVAVDRDAVI